MSGELIVSMVAPPWSEAALTDLPDGTGGGPAGRALGAGSTVALAE